MFSSGLNLGIHKSGQPMAVINNIQFIFKQALNLIRKVNSCE